MLEPKQPLQSGSTFFELIYFIMRIAQRTLLPDWKMLMISPIYKVVSQTCTRNNEGTKCHMAEM